MKVARAQEVVRGYIYIGDSIQNSYDQRWLREGDTQGVILTQIHLSLWTIQTPSPEAVKAFLKYQVLHYIQNPCPLKFLRSPEDKIFDDKIQEVLFRSESEK